MFFYIGSLAVQAYVARSHAEITGQNLWVGYRGPKLSRQQRAVKTDVPQ